jgi:phenol 2-monooxygenase
MTVPREDRLVRFYIQLRETEFEKDFDGAAFTDEKMVEQARKVLEPYTHDFEVCDWHSIYTVSRDRSNVAY